MLPNVTLDHLVENVYEEIPVWLVRVNKTSKKFQALLKVHNTTAAARQNIGDPNRTKRVFLQAWQIDTEIKEYIKSANFGTTNYIIANDYWPMFQEIALMPADVDDRPMFGPPERLMTSYFKCSGMNEFHLSLRDQSLSPPPQLPFQQTRKSRPRSKTPKGSKRKYRRPRRRTAR